MLRPMNRVAGRCGFAVLFGAIALLPRPSDAEPGAPCKDCKPKVATWDWKANGYAVAATPEAAKDGALARALELGCPASYKYLDATKLACGAGCNAGERTKECKPKGEPGCEVARYEEHKDQWLFVCRKAKGRAANTECTEAAATTSPFYSMCDVPILATATLPCTASCAPTP